MTKKDDENIKELTFQLRGQGIGITFKGGSDQRVNTDIIVSSILEIGLAHEDGNLKKGDKIIEVNDIPLKGMTHDQVVEYISSIKDVVRIKYTPKSIHQTPAKSKPWLITGLVAGSIIVYILFARATVKFVTFGKIDIGVWPFTSIVHFLQSKNPFLPFLNIQ